jgi:hypothetical protein
VVVKQNLQQQSHQPPLRIQLPHLDTIANTFLLGKHGRALTGMPDSLSATAAKRNECKMIISGFRLEGYNKQIAKKKKKKKKKIITNKKS